ncbi:MAG: hypothetical protein IJK07_04060 [Bacteroidales bacterium]|nr:hypothetical protein [Bacteroidales bacterium]
MHKNATRPNLRQKPQQNIDAQSITNVYEKILKTPKNGQKCDFANHWFPSTKYLPKFTQTPTKFLPNSATVDFEKTLGNFWAIFCAAQGVFFAPRADGLARGASPLRRIRITHSRQPQPRIIFSHANTIHNKNKMRAL